MTVHDIAVNTLSGQPASMGDLAGNTLLVVNVASKCGLTPQYTGLERLHERFAGRGFSVVGFPCNQFGGQEPGTAEEITEFCTKNFGVDFPVFAKVEVNGAGAHPLFRYLAEAAPGVLGTKRIKWNFTKFLIDRSGQVLRRFAPATRPEELRPAIEAAL